MREFQFLLCDALLFPRLREPLLGDTRLRSHLLQCLHRNKVLIHEFFGACELLTLKFVVRKRRPNVRVSLGTRFGRADRRLFHVIPKPREKLPFTHGVTTLDIDGIDDSYDCAADLGGTIRLDDAPQWLTGPSGGAPCEAHHTKNPS